MANFTASVYCKECKYSKAYYHGIYSNYPTVSYMCYYNCKATNPYDTCEHFGYKSRKGEVERMSRYIDIEPYEKDGWYLQKHYHNSYGEVIKTTPLVSVPTADAEPIKHGRWIIIDGEVVCSECCEHNLETNYCPNCGARMDERSNER